MKKGKHSRKSSTALTISSILVILFISCNTFQPIEIGSQSPSFEIVRPSRPVLEKVEIPEGTTIPDSLLSNYNALAMYALNLEDYAWGGDSLGGLEKYISDLLAICNL